MPLKFSDQPSKDLQHKYISFKTPIDDEPTLIGIAARVESASTASGQASKG